MNKVDLVIIDPQNDFCDPSGALSVPGAMEDMTRVSTLINRMGDRIHDIHVTLDTHHFVDIAHPIFWKNSSGKHPDPFTIITKESIKSGEWFTSLPSQQKRAEVYVEKLELNGKYPLCIWPPHCLIGTWGNNILPVLNDALIRWEQEQFANIDFVTKGSNPFTEHYSAIKADVPDQGDNTTQINTEFIKTLMDVDCIVVAGEAGSHCLANTVRDIAEEFGDDSYVKKIVLLTDGTSPVTGFENLQDSFIQDMVVRGMQLSTTVDFLK
jgi:nicotinamidase-related amidase